MLERLKELNPDIPIYSVNDDAYLPYGKVLEGYDVSELINECERIKMPEYSSSYELSIPTLESLEIAKRFKSDCFGGLDIQIGLCWGRNKQMNGLEFHKSSEVNVAITPMLLLLGQQCEMEGFRFHSKNTKGFFVDKGQVIEVYGPTLHFTPCEVSGKGFSSVVVLHKDTNDLLDSPSNDPLLFKKNKWLICHDSSSLKQKNVYPGIVGENIEIKY